MNFVKIKIKNVSFLKHHEETEKASREKGNYVCNPYIEKDTYSEYKQNFNKSILKRESNRKIVKIFEGVFHERMLA